jgi:hypothetical protein
MPWGWQRGWLWREFSMNCCLNNFVKTFYFFFSLQFWEPRSWERWQSFFFWGVAGTGKKYRIAEQSTSSRRIRTAARRFATIAAPFCTVSSTRGWNAKVLSTFYISTASLFCLAPSWWNEVGVCCLVDVCKLCMAAGLLCCRSLFFCLRGVLHVLVASLSSRGLLILAGVPWVNWWPLRCGFVWVGLF